MYWNIGIFAINDGSQFNNKTLQYQTNPRVFQIHKYNCMPEVYRITGKAKDLLSLECDGRDMLISIIYLTSMCCFIIRLYI